MKALIDRYITFLVVLAAIAIVFWAAINYAMDKDWILFLILAAMTIPFTTKLMLSVLFTGAPLLMAIAMIYGTATCVIAAAAYALLAALFLRLAHTSNARVLFANAAYMICEAFLYSVAYHLLRPVNLFFAITAMAFVSYLVTSFVRNTYERWTDRFPLLLNPFLAASCAAFLSAFHNPLMPFLAFPAVAVIRYWTRLHESRLRAVSIPASLSGQNT